MLSPLKNKKQHPTQHHSLMSRSHKRRLLVLQPSTEKDTSHDATLPELPEDLRVEIMSRLPVKSLLLFKCVCKSWKSLISSSNFANNHLHRSATDPNLRLHRLLGGDFIGHRFMLSRSLRSLLDNPSSTPPIFDDDLSFNVLPHSVIVGSCNGLICWVDTFYNFCNDRRFVYLNPTTKLKSKAPRFHHPWRDDSCSIMYGFGYDHLSDSYKTVAIYCDPKAENIENKTLVKVYALGEDTSWRKMQSFPFFPYCDEPCGKFVNDTLNWLATRPNRSLVVVYVDIASETCGELLLPPDVVDKYEVVESPKLWVLRGCLCFSHNFNGVQFILWQMKLYGATESWTILFKISYLDVGIDHHSYFHPTPIFMLDNGEFLLKIYNCGDFVLYNPKHKSFKYLNFRSCMRWFEGTTYIESLVSPFPIRN